MSTQSTPHSPFGVCLMVRDAANTKGAQRALLTALALRCSPDKGYSAFPSYAQLAQDTLLDQATLRRAAAKLEKAKLITRRRRDHSSNLFYLNVGLLHELAEEGRRKSRASREERIVAKVASPFAAQEIEMDENDPETAADASWLSGGAL